MSTTTEHFTTPIRLSNFTTTYQSRYLTCLGN